MAIKLLYCAWQLHSSHSSYGVDTLIAVDQLMPLLDCNITVSGVKDNCLGSVWLFCLFVYFF